MPSELDLKKWTHARIGLGRAGNMIPYTAVLEFKLAHAQARDSVYSTWNAEALRNTLTSIGEQSIILRSQVGDRNEYLKRPDLGRFLNTQSQKDLNNYKNDNYDITFVISDGLSAQSVDDNLIPFWKEIRQVLTHSYKLSPLFLVPFSRVAISDDIGSRLNTKMVILFIGERPGLSAHNSMGIYLTYAPKPGNKDSDRNCISNIKPFGGLPYQVAAKKLHFLIQESLRRQLSGVVLKDDFHLSSLMP